MGRAYTHKAKILLSGLFFAYIKFDTDIGVI